MSFWRKKRWLKATWEMSCTLSAFPSKWQSPGSHILALMPMDSPCSYCDYFLLSAISQRGLAAVFKYVVVTENLRYSKTNRYGNSHHWEASLLHGRYVYVCVCGTHGEALGLVMRWGEGNSGQKPLLWHLQEGMRWGWQVWDWLVWIISAGCGT